MKVGLTGHQNIGTAKDIQWVREAIINELLFDDIELGICSLAIGSDQLFARILLEKEVPLKVIIPSNGYEETFTAEERESYFLLKNLASDIQILPFPQPSEEAFYEAGKTVVKQSDILVAIWNGRRARGLGGTGDIVQYGLSQRMKIIHINPENHKIYKV